MATKPETVKIKGRNYAKPDLNRLTFKQAEAMDLGVKLADDPMAAGMTAPWRIVAAFFPKLPETVLYSLDLGEVQEVLAELDLVESEPDSVSMGESSPS